MMLSHLFERDVKQTQLRSALDPANIVPWFEMSQYSPEPEDQGVFNILYRQRRVGLLEISSIARLGRNVVWLEALRIHDPLLAGNRNSGLAANLALLEHCETTGQVLVTNPNGIDAGEEAVWRQLVDEGIAYRAPDGQGVADPTSYMDKLGAMSSL